MEYMSKEQEAEEGEEALVELRDLWSPLDPGREFYFHLPPSPQFSCLSPLWNINEGDDEELTGDIRVTITASGLPTFDCSRSAGDPGLSKSFTGNHDNQEQPLTLQCFKKRIAQALAYIKISSGQEVLAQVWTPVKRETKYVLTTKGQPFLLSLQNTGLVQYRTVSSMFMFPADARDGDLGLPGRVFQSKLPEWTPNAQYYSSTECPRLNHAILYNVRGILALPLFESEGCCIGVLELTMTSQKINYAPEIDLVCQALEILLQTVNLKSLKAFDLPHQHDLVKAEKIALGEISEVLTIVSETYKLPLAQTWVPSSKCTVLPSCGSWHANTSLDGRSNKEVCFNTNNVAFYVVDAHMWGFREASTEHILLKGQGVVGKAYLSIKSCLCRDITKFLKNEYPLVHYARMFGLHSCLAVPLRDIRTDCKLFILEFFLPPSTADFRYLQNLLDFLSATISQSSDSLRMTSHKDSMEEGDIGLINIDVDDKPALGPEYCPREQTIKPSKNENENIQMLETIRPTSFPDALRTGKEIGQMNSYKQPRKLEVDVLHSITDSNEGERNLPVTHLGKEYKCTLEVLKQQYGKNLNDAAECLGVSRSTLKRICRKHGITRWPSCKRKIREKFYHEQNHNNGLLQCAKGTISFNSPNMFPVTGSFLPTSSTNKKSIHHDLELSLKQKHGNLPSPCSILGELLIENTSSTMRNLQPQRAKSHFTESCGDMPSVLDSHLEKTVTNAATQNDKIASIRIKAKYGENMVTIRLHFPSALVDLEKEVEKKLKVKVGTFTLKYLDADGDWILIPCDEDLQDAMDVYLSKGVVRMLVEDINNL